jgi:heme-degrading monooxygenase HmoA
MTSTRSRTGSTSKEIPMIAVFVTFDADDLDEARVRAVVAQSRSMFEGMPGLRSKAYTLAETGTRATNSYVWESEDAARQFFSDDLIERVTGRYGVRPRIEFAEVVELVDNEAHSASHA